MSILSAKHAIERTAQLHGVTYEEVYREIENVISEALETCDSVEKMRWAAIPCKGAYPTPIELVDFLRKRCVT